jgi:hypothetical protein
VKSKGQEAIRDIGMRLINDGTKDDDKPLDIARALAMTLATVVATHCAGNADEAYMVLAEEGYRFMKSIQENMPFIGTDEGTVQ